MTSTELATEPEPERTIGRPALVAIASIVTVAFMGSVLVSPLYVLFQRKLGFSEITLTLIYAVYVVGNVLALLLFGQLSDQIGRKRVVVPALVLAAVSAVLFLVATNTAFLFAARVLIGLAVGVASGTGTAWLVDEFGPAERSLATLASATANLLGIALGPLLGGLLAQYVPAPLRTPFVVYIGILVVVALGVAGVRESGGRRIGLAAVRFQPRIGVPRELLSRFAAPAVTGFVTFAVAGLYFALIPALVGRDLHIANVAVGGAVVFELGVVAAATIVAGRRLSAARATTVGLSMLVPVIGAVVLAQALRSLPLLLAATAVGGVAVALGYRGSLQAVNGLAPPQRRAEVVSTYYIACFIGNSVPVIGIGVLSTVTSRLTGSVVFAVTVAVLAIAALLWRRAAPAH